MPAYDQVILKRRPPHRIRPEGCARRLRSAAQEHIAFVLDDCVDFNLEEWFEYEESLRSSDNGSMALNTPTEGIDQLTLRMQEGGYPVQIMRI